LHLAEAGCTSVFIGDSFMTTKVQPGDVTGVDPAHLHPVFLSAAGRAHTIALFGAEFVPSMLIETSTSLTFVDFFQLSKDIRPVGIVQVGLSTVKGSN
jgi:hypothetical protein